MRACRARCGRGDEWISPREGGRWWEQEGSSPARRPDDLNFYSTSIAISLRRLVSAAKGRAAGQPIRARGATMAELTLRRLG